MPALVDSAAEATADLLAREAEWLPGLTEGAIGPQGTHFVAPARRLSSAQQAALMLRETPRLPAVGCETGDWSHVDVYLTKTTDYRLVLFAGSRWEPQLVSWVAERGSTLVSIGGQVPGSAQSVRYPGDDEDDVRLLTEVLVAELLNNLNSQSGAATAFNKTRVAITRASDGEQVPSVSSSLLTATQVKFAAVM